MKSSKLILRPLHPKDEASFKNAVAAFGSDKSSFDFAFGFDESLPFEEYVNKLEDWSRGKGLPDRFVPSTFLVGVVDNHVAGRLSLRHRLNDFLERVGGHIGYGVVPSYRRKGYATEMVKQALPICSTLGIKKLLVTCDAANLASQKVIEKCGGMFENLTDDPQLKIQKRRYWIEIS